MSPALHWARGPAQGLLLMGLSLAACRRGEVSARQASADGGAQPTSSGAAPLGPRCGPGLALSLGSAGDEEVGDAVRVAGAIAVGLARAGDGGRTAGVALLAPDASSVTRVVDLGVLPGDAPPPGVGARGGDVLAAAYRVTKTPSERQIGVYVVSPSGAAVLAGTVPERPDDSFALDVGPGLVLWDETAPGAASRGVIRAAAVSTDGSVGAPHDVSPAESDADTPRVVGLGAGAMAFWIARGRSAPGLDASFAEVTGQPRSASWIEGVRLDAHGAVAGAVRRLTPATGHASSYDVSLVAVPQPSILLVVRDDGEVVDGSGGSLLRLHVGEDAADAPSPVPTEGLGRGSPMLVDGPTPWLAWVGTREEVRLAPLDSSGVPSAPASREPLLDDARPLVSLGDGRSLLVATEETERRPAQSRQLRVLGCAPR